MSLLVLDPGIESRIVDLGRPRTRSLGVPVGGAADRASLILGNALLGNPPDAAALEIALKGPRLRADVDLACSLCGAPFDVWLADRPIGVNSSFTLPAGTDLYIGGTRRNARAYLCVRGGFQTPIVLDSRSSLEPIRKGDHLPCVTGKVRIRSLPDAPGLFADSAEPIRVLPGLQAAWFEESEFYRQSFTVTPASNRMGLRLKGTPLTMPKREMISEPVCPGAIQVTPDGQCIILGVDGQTIGGYPKVAQVILADLDRLGQMAPGQTMRFSRIAAEEASRLDRAAAADLRAWTLRLQLSLDAFPAARTL